MYLLCVLCENDHDREQQSLNVCEGFQKQQNNKNYKEIIIECKYLEWLLMKNCKVWTEPNRASDLWLVIILNVDWA